MEATTLRDGRWSPMMEFPQGYGRIDSPRGRHPQTRRQSGRRLGDRWARVAGRTSRSSRICASPRFPPVRPAPRRRSTAFAPSADNLPLSHTNEAADVARVRGYRAKVGGKTWRIVRGDIHRHTDLSWDGNRDGSLDDSYRYALDAAGFDYLGVCDHQAGESIPYNWWRIQKAVDLYTIAGPLRADLLLRAQPEMAERPSQRVLRHARQSDSRDSRSEEASGEDGAANLFAYLRKFGGLTSPHTSATGRRHRFPRYRSGGAARGRDLPGLSQQLRDVRTRRAPPPARS